MGARASAPCTRSAMNTLVKTFLLTGVSAGLHAPRRGLHRARGIAMGGFATV